MQKSRTDQVLPLGHKIQSKQLTPCSAAGGCGCSAAAGACGVSVEPAQSSRPGTSQATSRTQAKANSFWQETCYTDNIELKPMLLDSSEQSI